MAEQAGDNPEGWAGRRPGRDIGRAAGANGAAAGTSGAWFPVRAWLAVLALLTLAVFVNVSTNLDDARRYGVTAPLPRVLTLELSSALAGLAAAGVILFAVRQAPPGRGPLWRTLAVHLGGTLGFSAAHVALMTLIRAVVFGLEGRSYPWSPAELPYEYRKDLLAYLAIAAIFWALARPMPAPPPAMADPAVPATFDIRDGAAILRVPVREILAARAAGNYVEFTLAGGRQPLMRASMAAIETALAPHGFVRTHRSWLVNARQVRGLVAAGSGDFRIDLGAGLTAPLSRRYPAALRRLKDGG